jgi:signal peptidase II
MYARSKLFKTLIAVALVFFLDLSTKQLVMRNLAMGEVIDITPFLNLVYVMNSGAAFGIFSGAGGGQGIKMALLSAIAMLPLIFLYRFDLKEKRRDFHSIGIILGGALGNIYDRLRYNAVVDFLDLHLQQRHWPAFNVADMAVIIGLGLFVLSLAIKPKIQSKASIKQRAKKN